ncbi:MAG: methylated-DNA--[protein]-cysteine S-methyltransferase [Gammaproteobacteria bacterium]|nr:MAG: methylated-DNA--[protein]-cysteine S-methyltransferase [Gammaproteobacteria bacterium]
MLDYRYRARRDAVDSRLKRGLNADFLEQDNDLLQLTRYQLNEYLAGNRKQFDIPLLTVGTDFQKQVWNALINIPFGKTCSYLELAKTLNSEKAVRAVAAANGANAISILIPCHRVIGSNGELTGYAGGLPVKKALLKLEGAVNNGLTETMSMF